MYKPELTEEEVNQLMELLDTALRQLGLNSAIAIVNLAMKIKNSKQEQTDE